MLPCMEMGIHRSGESMVCDHASEPVSKNKYEEQTANGNSRNMITKKLRGEAPLDSLLDVSVSLSVLANRSREAGFDRAEQERSNLLERLGRVADFYRTEQRYSELRMLLERAASILDRENGPNDLYLGFVLNDLGALHVRGGRWDEGERFCARALLIRERVLTATDPRLVPVLGVLAAIYFGQGRYEKAEERVAAPVVEEAVMSIGR